MLHMGMYAYFAYLYIYIYFLYKIGQLRHIEKIYIDFNGLKRCPIGVLSSKKQDWTGQNRKPKASLTARAWSGRKG